MRIGHWTRHDQCSPAPSVSNSPQVQARSANWITALIIGRSDTSIERVTAHVQLACQEYNWLYCCPQTFSNCPVIRPPTVLLLTRRTRWRHVSKRTGVGLTFDIWASLSFLPSRCGKVKCIPRSSRMFWESPGIAVKKSEKKTVSRIVGFYVLL